MTKKYNICLNNVVKWKHKIAKQKMESKVQVTQNCTLLQYLSGST